MQDIAYRVRIPEARIDSVHERESRLDAPSLLALTFLEVVVGRDRQCTLVLLLPPLTVVDPVGEIYELAVRLKTIHPEFPPCAVDFRLEAFLPKDRAEDMLAKVLALSVDVV